MLPMLHVGKALVHECVDLCSGYCDTLNRVLAKCNAAVVDLGRAHEKNSNFEDSYNLYAQAAEMVRKTRLGLHWECTYGLLDCSRTWTSL